MTLVQYLKETGVGTSAEIMGLAKADPAGFTLLKEWAKQQAAANGVTIEEAAPKS